MTGFDVHNIINIVFWQEKNLSTSSSEVLWTLQYTDTWEKKKKYIWSITKKKENNP